ncbi:hypothetical protein HDU88_004462 [Geranomyces variabilis]|nr:hypothetical protein HDU88_004462 [Geranomyces variabilis]
MKRTKYQQELEEALANLPEEETQALNALPHLSAILREVQSTGTSVAVRDCDDSDIRKVLQLDTSAVSRTSPSWVLPEGVDRYQPTKWFKRAWNKIATHWNLNSENSTRTIIDLVLLDVLSQDHTKEPDSSAQKMFTWTEISLPHKHGGHELNGRGDYSQ